MKTLQISVERNFHILNDDRFIMEKISHTIELDKDDDVQIAMNIARADIVENFKAAYPKVDTRLNFDEVVQVDYSKINYTGLKRQEQSVQEPKTYFSNNGILTVDKETASQLKDSTSEKTKTGTIEEQIDTSFNLIEEINKCKTLNMLKVYSPMLVGIKEVQAYDEKRKQLEAKKNPTVQNNKSIV